MDVGYQDASTQIDMQQMKEGVMMLAKINQHIESENGRKQDQDRSDRRCATKGFIRYKKR